MIALFNECPDFCPKCGCGLSQFHLNRDSQQDFLSGASCTCPKCKCSYAYASSEHLLAAAKASGGDLARYIDADENNVGV